MLIATAAASVWLMLVNYMDNASPPRVRSAPARAGRTRIVRCITTSAGHYPRAGSGVGPGLARRSEGAVA